MKQSPETARRWRRTLRRVQVLEEILTQVMAAVQSGVPADRRLAELLRSRREIGARDRRFISDTLFSYFRWQGWCQASGVSDLMGAVLLASLLDRPVAEDEGRAMIQRYGSRIPFNSLKDLHRLALRQKGELIARVLDLPRQPLPEELLPAWFWEAVAVPERRDRAGWKERLIASFQVRPPVWLRAPLGRGRELADRLQGQGVHAECHGRLKDAVRVSQAIPVAELRRRTGIRFEVQDLASQCVVEILDPQPGMRIWDASAGAGGKTLPIAERVGLEGWILATDIRPAVLRNAAGRIRAHGLQNVTLAQADLLADRLPERTFDAVLLDAPCSGTGTWNRNPDGRWRTPREAPGRFSLMQKRMLDRVAEKVRPGGRLVYSVCTLTKAETLDVIEEFLSARPDFALEERTHPLEERPESPVWVFPWMGPCDGMFIACLVRRR